VADLARAGHVVGDRHRGGAEVADAFHDQVVDDVGYDRIESGGRFVEEVDLGFAGDGACQRHALLHATAQLRGEQLADLGSQPDIAELVDRHLARLLGRHAVALDRAEGHVLPDAQRIEQRAALEQHAELAHDLAAAVIAEIDGLHAVDRDRAVVGLHQAEDAFQQHRLAGARAADHHHRFARRDVEVDAAQHLLRSEGLGDAAQRDLRGSH
jgi:hypothetical protein